MRLTVYENHSKESPFGITVKSSRYLSSNLNPIDFGTLVIFTQFCKLSSQKIRGAENTTFRISMNKSAFHNTGMSFDIWMIIFGFLLDKNNLKFILTAHEKKCYIPVSTSSLFAREYRLRFESDCLLDAALNADLIAVKAILENREKRTVELLLARSGTIASDNVGNRTGTPLQMAICNRDEEMVGFFKALMSYPQFQYQVTTVLGYNYETFVATQKKEAGKLCYILAATRNASLDSFKTNLTKYIKRKPVHNPYILECLLRMRVFKAAMLAQALSPKNWMQLYANNMRISPTRYPATLTQLREDCIKNYTAALTEKNIAMINLLMDSTATHDATLFQR